MVNKTKKTQFIKPVLIATGVYFAITSLLFLPGVIPSPSMYPTYKTGSMIFILPFYYGFSTANLPLGSADPSSHKYLALNTPKRGDVIIFRLNSFQGRKLIKRVIGIPGDHLSIDHGKISINGRNAEYKIANPSFKCDFSSKQCSSETEYLAGYIPKHNVVLSQEDPAKKITNLTVPSGVYFVMGDNRPVSLDSRYDEKTGAGLVPLSRIIGKPLAP